MDQLLDDLISSTCVCLCVFVRVCGLFVSTEIVQHILSVNSFLQKPVTFLSEVESSGLRNTCAIVLLWSVKVHPTFPEKHYQLHQPRCLRMDEAEPERRTPSFSAVRRRSLKRSAFQPWLRRRTTVYISTSDAFLLTTFAKSGYRIRRSRPVGLLYRQGVSTGSFFCTILCKL